MNSNIGIFNLDEPLSGPAPRWKRKRDACFSTGEKSKTGSTPQKHANKAMANTSTSGKTPSSITPGIHSKSTIGKSKTPKTPSADRFIPNRDAMNMDVSHHKVMNSTNKDDGSHQNNNRVLYTQNVTSSSCKKSSRFIPSTPERVLDAPDLVDDYYLNLLDWSVNNHVAIALRNVLYIWNAGDGTIHQLMQMESTNDYISAVSWIKEGNYLAVGTSTNSVQIWDVGQSKCLRSMSGHSARIGALSWNEHILASGSGSGAIHCHDVRVANHHISTLSNHVQEVCGLKWSPNGKYLASGGNDNVVTIWQDNSMLHSLTDHQAAVKAVSWCPWHDNLLATGGGTADRCIKLWNASTGSCLNSIDTASQVCNILWSKEYRELISGHGYSQYQLTIWKYPSMVRVTDLYGHTDRVLYMTLSPDGSTVASAAADETLRFWKCFAVDKKEKVKKTKSVEYSKLAKVIR
ncbi:uncharacterized protein TRIADDRAFT_58017 [Trichoplax adhaerens]|uniref:CDC20/Fizzy WD40 domain-containing protein n=1 Tax=Trichoplax adhaerens TaxID=10228 RepID=B3S2G5_TRIAD|nr:hypothetical protein TRIADDRAFT_58017 [Trichoplax adhaerens]EDV23414.1 hypothetical protein TRIADDRAFT_58017 [Trichoplax adhaerens]|eukprot:XP_002114324.1 hypothetical protein TRIADDRAFT_58017 [Trichoplax adhaerens]